MNDKSFLSSKHISEMEQWIVYIQSLFVGDMLYSVQNKQLN